MLSEASQDFVVGLLVGEGYELVAQDGEYDLLVRRRHALGARPAGVPLDVWAHVLDECTEGRYVAAARILEGCADIEGVLPRRGPCACGTPPLKPSTTKTLVLLTWRGGFGTASEPS